VRAGGARELETGNGLRAAAAEEEAHKAKKEIKTVRGFFLLLLPPMRNYLPSLLPLLCLSGGFRSDLDSTRFPPPRACLVSLHRRRRLLGIKATIAKIILIKPIKFYDLISIMLKREFDFSFFFSLRTPVEAN
jgi:hypothetical protein